MVVFAFPILMYILCYKRFSDVHRYYKYAKIVELLAGCTYCLETFVFFVMNCFFVVLAVWFFAYTIATGVLFSSWIGFAQVLELVVFLVYGMSLPITFSYFFDCYQISEPFSPLLVFSVFVVITLLVKVCSYFESQVPLLPSFLPSSYLRHLWSR